MSYQIPASLAQEIDELESLIARHMNGELDADGLKRHRVPFGIYEQRRENTYMVRIRCAGGTLEPQQLQTVATLSEKYGADHIHVTTRQELQIHDVALENVIPVLRQLLASGLATRGGGGNTVRNILVSPDSGISPKEVFDVTPYAVALTTRLISEPDSWLLPRKFKIAFSNSGEDTAYATFNDLGFIATLQDEVKGFKVYMAGGMGSKPQIGQLVHDFIPAAQAYSVAEALKKVFHAHGDRKNKHAARLRFLWNQLGRDRFLALYREELERLRDQETCSSEPQDSVKRTATISLAPASSTSPGFELWKRRYVTPQRQTGFYSILIPLFLGNLGSHDALALADFLAPFGTDVVRVTLGQNLRLRNIPEAYLGNVHLLITRISELANWPRFVGEAVTCTGADTCKLGNCLPKGAMKVIVKKLVSSGLDLDQIPDFKLNISGCPNSCGQHWLADLGFHGRVGRKGGRLFPAYAIVAGARVGDGISRLARPIDRVSARDLPDFIVELLRGYLVKKKQYPSFGAYVDGEGTRDIRALCDHYRDVPDFEEDSNYYFDWGAHEEFSLAGKGDSECSAGAFD